jgi:putative phosphoribosyl transferase
MAMPESDQRGVSEWCSGDADARAQRGITLAAFLLRLTGARAEPGRQMPFARDEQGFENRRDAGRRLAAKLVKYAGEHDVVVLALPRGGVPVAYEVAELLAAPLDVFLVRKLGVPGHDELAMGAIASGGLRVLNEDVIHALRLSDEAIDAVTAREWRTLRERELTYRGERPRPKVQGCTVILVDDGLATGASMRAAVQTLNEERPKQLVAAVPVAPPETCEAIRAEVDEIVCALMPATFHDVGRWYEDFVQTTDEEVRELLGRRIRKVQLQRESSTPHSPA